MISSSSKTTISNSHECVLPAQEHLIEREFLKRDEKNRHAYVYLP